ncbi:DUF5960 family protein [Streptococcus marimammalium]|uniref:DUF5960 family protein n=1 Tax=Streptococcus marimammalium TaxID=269666 RepID=UPI000365E1D7|nr:DUF5960 family protein [Streptococcus marimammalium]
MSLFDYEKNALQMDYFSENYRQFEKDFYKYSALDIPLTFLTDDLMRSMANAQKSYFKLNKENAKDGLDHYFFFSIETPPDNTLIRKYTYQKTMTSLK